MELWNKNQGREKDESKGRNVYAAWWCPPRKGTTDRRAYLHLHMYEWSKKPEMLPLLPMGSYGIRGNRRRWVG